MFFFIVIKVIKYKIYYFVVVVQLLSCVQLCNPMDCSTPDFPVFHYLLGFAQVHVPESVILFNHLNLCHPLLLLPLIFPSIRVFSNILLTIFNCTVQWHWMHSHCCATLIIIYLPNFFTFLNWNSVPIKH